MEKILVEYSHRYLDDYTHKTKEGFGWYFPTMDKFDGEEYFRSVMSSDGAMLFRNDFKLKCIDPRYTIPLDREAIIKELLEELNTQTPQEL